MANNMTCQIKGIGTIKIRMSDGVEITLTDVMYVPELKRNMISLGTLDAVGYTFKAFNGVLEVAKGALTVMKGTRRNGLYILRGTTILHVTTVASVSSSVTIKLSHMTLPKEFYELGKPGPLGDGQTGKIDFCDYCVFGKNKKK